MSLRIPPPPVKKGKDDAMMEPCAAASLWTVVRLLILCYFLACFLLSLFFFAIDLGDFLFMCFMMHVHMIFFPIQLNVSKADGFLLQTFYLSLLSSVLFFLQ